MKKIITIIVFGIMFFISEIATAAPHYVSGKIVSLLASGTDPAIRISGIVSPTQCNGGNYNWLYFKGTPEERNRIYASALAFSLSGKHVTVYTNADGGTCRINNIQVTSGLN